jgi:NAD(P)H-dependent FMN reductase
MKLAIIIGSTRPGRVTERLARWVINEAKELPQTDLDIIDLVDYDMPLFNETSSPRYNSNRQLSEPVREFLAKLDSSEAVIMVTPEYNHSMPAVLKNALDYVDWQLSKKPIAFVGHGTVGGARAIEHLKNIVSETKGLPIPESVAFTMRVNDVLSEEGVLSEEIKSQQYGPQTALDIMLKELAWYSAVLTPARSKTTDLVTA